MLPMGTGAIAGVPVKGAQTVLGAGPIRAYHSSPYDFDKFDISKIGTGEGTQAYGSGLYFAENPNVAQHYRNLFERRGLPARTYEVNIKADPAEFFNWDGFIPPSYYSSVNKALQESGKPLITEPNHAVPGESLYRQVKDILPPEETAKTLSGAGFPGIRFLDKFSHGWAPSGNPRTRNYSVFNDKLIDILKKYGVSSVAALPPAVQAAFSNQADNPL